LRTSGGCTELKDVLLAIFVEALQRADEQQKDFLFVRPMDYI